MLALEWVAEWKADDALEKRHRISLERATSALQGAMAQARACKLHSTAPNFSAEEHSTLYNICYTGCTQPPPNNHSSAMYQLRATEVESVIAEEAHRFGLTEQSLRQLAKEEDRNRKYLRMFLRFWDIVWPYAKSVNGIFKYVDRFYCKRLGLPDGPQIVYKAVNKAAKLPDDEDWTLPVRLGVAVRLNKPELIPHVDSHDFEFPQCPEHGRMLRELHELWTNAVSAYKAGKSARKARATLARAMILCESGRATAEGTDALAVASRLARDGPRDQNVNPILEHILKDMTREEDAAFEEALTPLCELVARETPPRYLLTILPYKHVPHLLRYLANPTPANANPLAPHLAVPHQTV